MAGHTRMRRGGSILPLAAPRYSRPQCLLVFAATMGLVSCSRGIGGAPLLSSDAHTWGEGELVQERVWELASYGGHNHDGTRLLKVSWVASGEQEGDGQEALTYGGEGRCLDISCVGTCATVRQNFIKGRRYCPIFRSEIRDKDAHPIHKRERIPTGRTLHFDSFFPHDRWMCYALESP